MAAAELSNNRIEFNRVYPNVFPSVQQFIITLILLVLCHARSLAVTGATVPWTTVEAETMTVNGVILGPSYAPNVVAAESSGRRYAQLSSTGHYVQFTAAAAANSLVVRYSVPDAAGGGGVDYTISLYKNGAFIGKLLVTSKYSWLYGAYPFVNTPGSGSPRNFYDEVRTNGVSISPGDVIKLQKDVGDTAPTYVIDLVDLEDVAAPLSQPANSLSIMSYGAAGNGTADDTTALINCISAANAAGKITWLPAGKYRITQNISLASNTKIQGAGMWHTTLLGDPAFYPFPGNRVQLSGNGGNIQLADFAIVGCLAYRSDTEANDGIGGAFGTGSTISRLWIEHTKTGIWVVNSQGLVVSDCRFRNTIADGLNFSVGMRGSVATNCTARGTGDDCFAIWPATYLAAAYTPGLNTIRNCTAQSPWLANGLAIYGAESNVIEDSIAQDTTYGCGILISTTFTVSHSFSGTTRAQRSFINRCGGNDPGFSWRGAVQLCLDNKSLTGVNLNNLLVTNSASDGVSIIAPGSNTGTGVGTLANAIMSNVTIPNYGLGTAGRHGLWARSDTIGSMTVSNCTIVEFQDASANFAFNFVTSSVPVTIQTSPIGRTFSADGTNYTSSQTFNWLYGTAHTIGTTSPQTVGGTQYVWTAWSDAGAMSHSVTSSVPMTNTASFSTQYFLTMSASAGGSVSPSSRWTNSGTVVGITATASNGFVFAGWSGSGAGSYSGTNNPAVVTMNGAITQTANFTAAQSPQAAILSYLQQPTAVFQSASITPAVQVRALDTNGSPVVGASIAIALASGAGTISGTLTQATDASGIAQFSNLSFNQPGPKTLTASALSGAASPTNSTSFLVVGPATALVFSTQPGSATAGSPFVQQPVLKTVDSYGTPSTSGLPANLTVSVSLSNGVGTLTGTAAYNIGTGGSNGVVNFMDLGISLAGSNYQLVAATLGGSVTPPVASMNIWLDASVATSVQTNASGLVTNWLDNSGFNNHFSTTIGSGGNGIRYTNTTANGLRTVTFNATGVNVGTELKNSTYTNTSKTVSVFVVARKTLPGTNEGAYQHVFATWAGGANPDYADVGSYSLDYNISNTTPRVIRGCCSSYVDNNCPAFDPSAGLHVIQYVADGLGSNGIWLATASGRTQGNGPLSGNISSNFNIVASTVGGGMINGTTINNPFAGSVAEVLVYSTALNPSDRVLVENYLTNKWLGAEVPGLLAAAVSAPFNVAPAPISVTVQPDVPGRAFTVDSVSYTNAQMFSWPPGSVHMIAAPSPQSGGAGVQYVWSSWSDGGAISHNVSPTSNTIYTVSFTTQFYLTMNSSSGGNASPASGWVNSNSPVSLTASSDVGFAFTNWTGVGTGSYSGTNPTPVITMNSAVTQTAAFELIPTRVLELSGALNFGSVNVGSSSNRLLTISNAGNATLTVNFVTQPVGFTGGWSGTIPPGGATNVTVAFAPLAAIAYTGNLVVVSDATSGTNEFGVSGIGVNAPPSAQSIVAITVVAGTGVTITYNTTPGYAYHLETATNLHSPVWQLIEGSTTNASGSQISFTDTNSPDANLRIYRTSSP